MSEQALREKIETILRKFKGTAFDPYSSSVLEANTQEILNLLKEELEGLTVIGDTFGWNHEREHGRMLSEAEVFLTGANAQLQHTINELGKEIGK